MEYKLKNKDYLDINDLDNRFYEEGLIDGFMIDTDKNKTKSVILIGSEDLPKSKIDEIQKYIDDYVPTLEARQPKKSEIELIREELEVLKKEIEKLKK